jgi:hypothetical protein
MMMQRVLPNLATVIALWMGIASGAPAAVVAEFYNHILDNYFITGDTNEAAAIDNGSAGPGWSRTGDAFNAGGSSPVCRFYGSLSPGPNSHFYTVSAGECAQLKQLQATTPATEKRWNFESLDFVTTTPVGGVCPNGTVPVYRAYNNGFARGVDSNHRITANPAGIQQVVDRGWISEGVVMCAASASTVAAIAQFWQQAAGVWLATQDGQPIPILFRFSATGGYLMADWNDASPASGTMPGLERGAFAYDPLTGHFTAIVSQDTNGRAGLSDRTPEEMLLTIAIAGADLLVTQPDGTELARLQRVANDPGSVVGAWEMDTAGNLAAPHFVFFADGRYLSIDPIGDTTPSPCGGPGIEYGTYAWDGSTGTLTLTGVSIDTNGCTGLNEPPNPGTLFQGMHSFNGITLSADGSTLSAGSKIVLERVSQ